MVKKYIFNNKTIDIDRREKDNYNDKKVFTRIRKKEPISSRLRRKENK